MNRDTNRKTEDSDPPGESSRQLRLRMRADLEVVAQNSQGRDYWVIKDPVSLKYYRFEAEELAILQMLDGVATAESIRAGFERRFAPQRLTNPELYQLIAMLHRNALVIADAPGQGEKLFERHQQQVQRERRQWFTNPLSIRFRGVDPDRFLTWLERLFGWFFSWPAFVAVLCLGLAALSLVAVNFGLLMARMPAFEEFFAGSNWFWLSVVLILTKVAHELGHGLACKRFGGECNEMGVMLLVLMPCLYCNVSDSWMLPDKWKRATIAAAGMYVELVLASLATFVWWFSEPGLVNQLALNVMFICSVTTLLFNINPLLKYDGYYILSDLTGIPNLRNKASGLLQGVTSKWVLGLEQKADPFLPTRHYWWFVAYAVAAAVYQWVITFSVFWFLYGVLEPRGLKILGQILAVTAVGALVIVPMVRLVRFFSIPGRWWAVNKVRLATVAGLASLLLLGVLLFPVPHVVRCSFYIQPSGVGNVYVTVAGFVRESLVQNGQRVEQGQPLVVLENPDLVLEIERLQGDLDVAHARVVHAEASSSFDVEQQASLESARAAEQTALNRLARKLEEAQRLVIAAPCSGIFVSDAPRPRPDPRQTVRLAAWHGSPVAQRNLGAWFETQTRIGRIEDGTARAEAILAVDQGEIEYLQPDQKVSLWIRQQPGAVFQSATRQISPARMFTVPPALSSRCGGDLVTTRDADGNDVPQSATWQVSVPLQTDAIRPVSGATGTALVRVGTQPLVRRIWRELCRTFRFDL